IQYYLDNYSCVFWQHGHGKRRHGCHTARYRKQQDFHHRSHWQDRENIMKAQPPLCPNAGFSLLETMLALAILSIGLLALAGLQVTALRGNMFSRTMAIAVSIAEQRLEELKNTPYANIAAESATQVTASNMNFTRQVTVADGPVANTKAISVIVSWQEKSQTHTLPINTIIGQ